MKNDAGRLSKTRVSGRRTRRQQKGNEYPAAIAAPLMPELKVMPSAHRPGHHLQGRKGVTMTKVEEQKHGQSQQTNASERSSADLLRVAELG